MEFWNFCSLLCLDFLFSARVARGHGARCATDGGRVAGMPLTAAERRTRRRAVANTLSIDFDCAGDSESDGADSAALAHSDSDDSESDGTDGAALARSDNDERRTRRRAVKHAARRANSSVYFDCDGDSESDGADGAALAHSDSDDSDSDGVDDSRQRRRGRRVRRRTKRWCALPRCSTRWRPVGLRQQQRRPGCCPTPPRTSCPTATLLRALLLAGLLC